MKRTSSAPSGPVTVAEFAERSGKSRKTVRDHALEWGGFKLPGCRDWLFRRRDVAELLGDE